MQLSIIAEHTIYTSDGTFTISDEIDPKTGEFKIVAVPRIFHHGDWLELPEDEARDLIAREAAREPTQKEWELRRMSGAPTP